MDQKQDPMVTMTKADFQKMANRQTSRQTSIVVPGVVFGMCIGNTVGEAMAGQPFWLRLLAVALSTGLGAGILAYLIGKFLPAKDLFPPA